MDSHDIVFKHIDKDIADDFKERDPGSYNLFYPILLNLAKRISEFSQELAYQRSSGNNSSKNGGNCNNNIKPKDSPREGIG